MLKRIAFFLYFFAMVFFPVIWRAYYYCYERKGYRGFTLLVHLTAEQQCVALKSQNYHFLSVPTIYDGRKILSAIWICEKHCYCIHNMEVRPVVRKMYTPTYGSDKHTVSEFNNTSITVRKKAKNGVIKGFFFRIWKKLSYLGRGWETNPLAEVHCYGLLSC